MVKQLFKNKQVLPATHDEYNFYLRTLDENCGRF